MKQSYFLEKLFKVFEWITRIVVSNLLWCVSSFPTLFILLSLLLAETETQVITLGATLAVLVPLNVFPSLTALFTVVVSWRKGNRGYTNIKLYLQSFRQYFKQSVLLGIGVVGVIFVWSLLVRLLVFSTGMQLVSLWVIATLTLTAAFNTLASLSYQEGPFKQHLLNGTLMTLVFPFTHFLLALFIQALFVGSVLYAQYILLFFLVSCSAYLIGITFEKNMERVEVKKNKMRLKSRDWSEMKG